MADAQTTYAINNSKKLLGKYGAWINKYRGGMPAGFMAAIMNHESGGNFGAAGDAQLGEVGFYQIAAYVPPLFGYPASVRSDPETNVALAALEYAYEAARWHRRYPELVRLGTPDSWKLARMSFAIGAAGSWKLADLAKASAYLQPGAVYDGIAKYVAAAGAPLLGSQSSSKVAMRVASIAHLWAVGQAVESGYPGRPTYIPNPPAGPYTIPADVVAYFVRPIPGIVLAVLGVTGGVLYYIWKRR